MQTSPARRIVEEVLNKHDAYLRGDSGYRRVAFDAAPKIAKMLKVALDALEEIKDVTVGPNGEEFVSLEALDARDALAKINELAEVEQAK